MKNNRTVKELNIEFEELLGRVNILEQNAVNEKRNGEDTACKDFKEIITEYDEKIKLLAKRLEDSEKRKEIEIITRVDLKCNQCEKTFQKKACLKKHVSSDHPKDHKCESCGEHFDQSWKLESHMSSHKEMERFKCDECDKDFSVEWRMRKHKKAHAESTKYCHYYNNAKGLPLL